MKREGVTETGWIKRYHYYSSAKSTEKEIFLTASISFLLFLKRPPPPLYVLTT